MGVRHTETNLIIWSAQTPEPPVAVTFAAPAKTELLITGAVAASLGADHFYDAGDQGCAFGPLDEIARIMRRMAPGQTLEVRATDATVAIDLSAWCRMTGHTLLEQQGDRYLLRRKAEG